MKENGFEGLSWLFKLAGRQRGKLVASCVLAALAAVLGLAPYYLVYLIVAALDTAQAHGQSLTMLALATLLALLFKAALHFCANLLSHRAAFNLLFGLRESLAIRLGAAPMGALNNRTSGQIRKVLGDDIERLELFIAHHLPDLAAAVTMPLAVGVVLFFVDWRLALAAVAPLPLALLTQAIILRGHEEKMREYHDNTERMNSAVVEYVRGMMIIKVFNLARGAFGRYQRAVSTYSRVLEEWIKASAGPLVVFKITLELGVLILAPLSFWLYQAGQADLATMLLFLLLGLGLMEPLLRITFMGGLLGQIVEGASRIDELLSCPPLPTTTEEVSFAGWEVEFRGVGFAYEPGRPVLRGVSFIAPAGKVTALVGPSGAGKSTAAQLLARLWDVDEGAILLGGRDIRQAPLEQLMKNVSFVFQDVHIFNKSVLDNIRMGKENATREEVEWAARQAQAHEFICGLENGYDTVLGSGQAGLSGGERQRMAIARAILKNAPVIVLDEATAYADPCNELLIQRALDRLLVGKTVIVVAHRLSTVAETARIVFFERGAVLATGTHAELLETCPHYAAMWAAHGQARGFRLRPAGASSPRLASV